MKKTFLEKRQQDLKQLYHQIDEAIIDPDIKEQARVLLDKKIKEIGFDKESDFDYFKHHAAKLALAKQNQIAIDEDTYQAGAESLPRIVSSIAAKIAAHNPTLENLDRAAQNYTLTDLTKLYGKRVSQREIDQINSRITLKDHASMEDLMSLSTNELRGFRDMVTKHRRSAEINSHEHYEATQFSFLLNKVIEKHNKEHDSSQTIEPVEMMIDLDKSRKLTSANLRERLKQKKLPRIVALEEHSSVKVTTPSLTSITEEHRYSEFSPNSSKSTVVSNFSASSYDSDKTVELYTSTLVSSASTPPTKTPIIPTTAKPSFRRPGFRDGH